MQTPCWAFSRISILGSRYFFSLPDSGLLALVCHLCARRGPRLSRFAKAGSDHFASRLWDEMLLRQMEFERLRVPVSGPVPDLWSSTGAAQ